MLRRRLIQRPISTCYLDQRRKLLVEAENVLRDGVCGRKEKPKMSSFMHNCALVGGPSAGGRGGNSVALVT